MKFVMSYSGGKDSALALYRMVRAGHEPVALLVTLNPDQGRSWFHGIPNELLDAVADRLGVPLLVCACPPAAYTEEFENTLRRAKTLGAEACAFGDIDIEDHRVWDEERCAAAGLGCQLPLWREDRAALTAEGMAAGFRAVIKLVRLDCLDTSYLGQTLTPALTQRIAAAGADICGENGEYHTFVYDGPLFSSPVPLRLGEILFFGTHAAVDIV